MGKKKRQGHYCWGCDTYKSNESFSGKGHRNHLCKKCKAAGVTKRPESDDFIIDKPQKHNPFMKSLKIAEVMFVEAEEFIFFQRGGQLYVWMPEDESLILSINLKQEQQIGIPDNLVKEDNIDDITDALRTKRESRMMNGQYVSIESWAEIEEIQEMGLLKFEEKVHQVLGYEDEEELDEYLQLETSFYPSEFQWELYEMDNKLREIMLLLPSINQYKNIISEV
jgi:hypothetical protein